VKAGEIRECMGCIRRDDVVMLLHVVVSVGDIGSGGQEGRWGIQGRLLIVEEAN